MKAIPYAERIRLASRIPQEGQAAVMGRMEQFSEDLQVVNLRPSPVDQGLPMKAVVFNMERGVHLRESADFLLDCPAFRDMDLILANELDDGACRSGCIDTARELAERLHMNYTFGLEFVELANEKDPKGYHGNAIFSRWPIRWAKARYLPEAYNWYFDRQTRIGGRLAIYALLEVGERTVGAVCVHFENRTDGPGRVRQMQAVLEGAEELFPPETPVLIGGDLNTNTFDGDKVEQAYAMYQEILDGKPPRDVPAMEGALTLAEQHGYQFRTFNGTQVPTRRKRLEGGVLEMQLDWLLAKGFDCVDHGMVSTRTEDCGFARPDSALASFTGPELSDHNAVWAVCRRSAPLRAVFFDMGGTLEDAAPREGGSVRCVEALTEMLTGLGQTVEETPEEFWRKLDQGVRRYKQMSQTRFRELPTADIWSDYYLADFSFDRGVIRENAERFAQMWEVTYYRRSLREGVPEMLERLRQAGYRLGIVSNNASFYAVFQMLEHYGIRDYFEDVTVSSTTGFRKPAPEIFRVAMLKMGLRPEECAYVGDTISRDVIGPRQAGMACTIHIDSGLTGVSDAVLEHRSAEADHVVSDICQVADLLT